MRTQAAPGRRRGMRADGRYLERIKGCDGRQLLLRVAGAQRGINALDEAFGGEWLAQEADRAGFHDPTRAPLGRNRQ